MANLERKYVITLRKEFKKVPFYLRARKAVKAVRAFLQKNMKSEDVRLGKHLNLLLWSRGNRNPPHRVEVIATKFEEKGVVYVTAELVGAPKEEAPQPKKKGGLTEKLKEKVIAKEPADSKAEEKKEQMQELRKEEEEVMEHAEAPRPKKKTSFKTKEVIEKERERSVIARDKKDVQHKKPKSE